jgi:hypothetical protein
LLLEGVKTFPALLPEGFRFFQFLPLRKKSFSLFAQARLQFLMLPQKTLEVDLGLPPAFLRFLHLAKTLLNFLLAAGEEGFIFLKCLPNPLQVLVEVLLLLLEGD